MRTWTARRKQQETVTYTTEFRCGPLDVLVYTGEQFWRPFEDVEVAAVMSGPVIYTGQFHCGH